MSALSQPEGYAMHRRKLEIAYRYREALRLRNWHDVKDTIAEYRSVRSTICPAYLDGAKEIQGFADAKGCVSFPLGAGGGGGILVFSPAPEVLESLRKEIGEVYRDIPVRIKQHGHELLHLPLEEE